MIMKLMKHMVNGRNATFSILKSFMAIWLCDGYMLYVSHGYDDIFRLVLVF